MLIHRSPATTAPTPEPSQTGGMTVEQEVARRGGVIRSGELRALGWSAHRLGQAVASGRLIRPVKGWVAVPGADPDLLAAAQRGGTLTCVSQARRIGLWTPRFTETHLAVTRPGSQGSPEGYRFHWARPVRPREPDALEDHLENLLGYVAVCLPYEEALAVWESALQRGMTDLLTLQRLPYTGAARRLLADSTPFSDSGLETYVRRRLRWLDISLVPQVWIEGHRVDFLLGARLVLQIDGGHHVGPQRTRDIEHDARLALRGYTVIRVGYEQVVFRWHEVHESVTSAIARGLHTERAGGAQTSRWARKRGSPRSHSAGSTR